jgi:hypothetical protein
MNDIHQTRTQVANRSHLPIRYLLGASSLAALIAFSIWSTLSTDSSSILPAPKSSDSSSQSIDWEKIASPHLLRCQQRVSLASQSHTEPIVDLLNRAQVKVPKFSKTALSFASKWRLIADSVPYTKGDRNEIYLREEFESIVLRSSDLEDAIQESIASFLQEIRSIENQMLVELRADLDDFPQVDWSKWKDDETLREQFDIAIATAMESSNTDFKNAVGSQLISLIAGEVLTQVAVRVGVSAGILGTGAASGWATLGIGVVAGIVIDQVVSTVWKYWDNPETELTEQIQSQLSNLQRLICEGDETTRGLRQHYTRVSEERDSLRRLAIHSLLNNMEPAP